MTKFNLAKLEKTMNEYGMFGTSGDAFQITKIYLEFILEKIETEEPYAVNTITELKNMLFTLQEIEK